MTAIRPNLPAPAIRTAREPASELETATPRAVEISRPVRTPVAPRDGYEAGLGRAYTDLARGDEAQPNALLPKKLSDLVRKLDLDKVRSLLETIYPPRFRNEETDAYTEKTAPFREALGVARERAAELAALPPGDPGIPAAQAALRKAEDALYAISGHTLNTVPPPGSLWVDPQFMGEDLLSGPQLARGQTLAPPVLRPPEPMELLFGTSLLRSERSFTFDAGADSLQPELTTVHDPLTYQAHVAAHREQLGVDPMRGEPIGVHLSFQGGGGRGKRYAPALMELMQQGVVPTSTAGSSVGSIAAALVAAGADAADLGAFVTDPRINTFFDFELPPDDGGLLNGDNAYALIDEELRRLTGITDRPVTFRDLPMPLKVYTAIATDSEAADGSMTAVADRLFTFSQETTPDTPVALAVRASMAIPGLYDPVQMVDPTTGRQLTLVDGGTLDNLPVGNDYGLPEIGMSLLGRNTNHPGSDANNAPRGPLPAGNLDAGGVIWNAFNGWHLLQSAGSSADDFRDRTQPDDGRFMLSLPIWNLRDPSQANGVLGFGYDPEIDPALDAQTRALTQQALAGWLEQLQDPQASGTNVTATLPGAIAFEREIELGGDRYRVRYEGGDAVHVRDAQGNEQTIKLGEARIQAMWLDDQAFGDLSFQLAHELKGELGGGFLDWFRAADSSG